MVDTLEPKQVGRAAPAASRCNTAAGDNNPQWRLCSRDPMFSLRHAWALCPSVGAWIVDVGVIVHKRLVVRRSVRISQRFPSKDKEVAVAEHGWPSACSGDWHPHIKVVRSRYGPCVCSWVVALV